MVKVLTKMFKQLIIAIFALSTFYGIWICSVNSCLNNGLYWLFNCNNTEANCTNELFGGFNNSNTTELINYPSSYIIGGTCPCPQLNAFCKEDEDACYCDYNYMPSINKLRCIKRAVALNEPCELDEQCQQKDFNSICDPLNKTCVCINNFLNIRNDCRSIIGDDFKCQNNADCFDNYGESISYCSDFDKCYCIKDYLKSTTGKSCLLASQYKDFCFNDIHCTFNMGLGAKCFNNTCHCTDNYVLHHTNNGKICTKKIERGQYCLTNADCYQYQLNDVNQSLECIYAECQCKSGFYSINDGDCQRGSFATKGLPILLLIMFSYVIQIL